MAVGLILTLVVLLSATSAAMAMSVTTTVPVGKGPSGLAYDPAKGEIFVTNGQDNTVSVVSDSTNTVIATIDVGTYPYGAAYDSARGEVFVVNLNSNNVSVISDLDGGKPDIGAASPGGSNWLILLIIVIIIVIILLLWYRGRKLTVTVQDARTRAPIPGARVSVEGPEKYSGVTERDGRIVFSGPPEGDYKILAVASGYAPSTPLTVSVERRTKLTVLLASLAPDQSVAGPYAPGGAMGVAAGGPVPAPPAVPQDPGATIAPRIAPPAIDGTGE